MTLFGILVVSFITMVILSLITYQADSEMEHINAMMIKHREHAQQIYEQRRPARVKNMWRYSLMWPIYLIVAVISFIWPNVLSWLIGGLMLIYHVWVVRKYLQFWRPEEYRKATRVYKLRTDRDYIPDDDGELIAVKRSENEEPATSSRFELTDSGEIIEIKDEKH